MISVGKSASDLNFSCEKPGFEAATTTGASSFNGWILGNIVFGGIIGVIVDASTAATFDYPALVQLDLTAKASNAIANDRTAGVANSVRVAAVNQTVLTTRMMDLPDNSRAKQAFLLGACSAGDQTACIIAGR